MPLSVAHATDLATSSPDFGRSVSAPSQASCLGLLGRPRVRSVRFLPFRLCVARSGAGARVAKSRSVESIGPSPPIETQQHAVLDADACCWRTGHPTTVAGLEHGSEVAVDRATWSERQVRLCVRDPSALCHAARASFTVWSGVTVRDQERTFGRCRSRRRGQANEPALALVALARTDAWRVVFPGRELAHKSALARVFRSSRSFSFY